MELAAWVRQGWHPFFPAVELPEQGWPPFFPAVELPEQGWHPFFLPGLTQDFLLLLPDILPAQVQERVRQQEQVQEWARLPVLARQQAQASRLHLLAI